MMFKKYFSWQNLLGGLLLISMLLATGPLQVVKADSSATAATQQSTFTLKDLGYTSDDEYQGVQVSHQYDVNLPQVWAFTQPLTLTLHFGHAHALNAQSTMSVDWNDVRVGSVLLSAANADDGSLTIQIPAAAVAAGYNKLTVQFYMGISDNFCDDYDNPAVWAVVHTTTSFALTYAAQSPVIDLHSVSSYLIDPSPIRANEVTLVLPSAPTTAELDAAALVSAKFGQLADWRTLEVKTLPLDQLDAQSTAGNVIVVGTAQHLAQQSASLLPTFTGSGDALAMQSTDGSAIAKDSGVLWLQASPNDDESIWLTVTGASDAALQKAARAFATTSAFDRLAGPLGVILDTPASADVATVSASPDLSYTLTELGYQDLVATGSRQQSTYLTFPLQLVFASQGEATLKLFYSHSAVLNPDRSSLDVLVNGIPVGSTVLNSQNAQQAEFDVKIPLRLLKLGDNTLALTSNLQVNHSAQDSTLYCTDKYYSDSWLTISPDSTLSFPSGIGEKTASLAGFPNLYFGSPSLANLAFIVPDNVDWTTATTVLQMANRLGHTAKGDQLLSAVLPASAPAAATADRPYQILIGLPSQNAAITQVNDLLPQPFADDKVTPKPLKDVADIAPANGALGYIESLYTKDGQYRLVLTATSSKGLDWIAQAVNTPTLYKSFDGNLAILSSATEVAFFTISSNTSLVSDQPVTSTATASTGKINQYPGWIVWLAIAILVLSLFTALLIRLLRNRK